MGKQTKAGILTILITGVCLAVLGMAGCNNSSQGADGLVGKPTLDQLTATADSILVGTVTDITCHQEGKTSVYTLITLSVEQTIKGETGGEVVIRVPGGEIDGLELFVTDTPSFHLEERTMVFLKNGEGAFTVVGGFHGKFTIDSNNMVNDMPLAEFIDQINDILARQ